MQLNVKAVDGVTYDVLSFGPGKRACLPINLSVGFETLVEPVRTLVRGPPATSDAFPFPLLLGDALSQTYPCPSSLGR